MNALQDNTELPIRYFLHTLCKRKKLIVTLFLSTVTIVVISTFLSTPVYEATAQILVKVGRENLFTPPATLSEEVSEPKFFSDNQEAQTNSEVEILKSRILAKNIITSVGVKNIYPKIVSNKHKFNMGIFPDTVTSEMASSAAIDKAVALLQKNLHIESIKKTNVIQLTFLHNDRDIASKVLDTLLSKYMVLHLQIHRNSQSSKYFDDRLKTQLDELQQAQEKLSSFKKEYAIATSPSAMVEQMMKVEGELEVALNQTLSDEAETEGRLKMLRTQITNLDFRSMQKLNLNNGIGQAGGMPNTKTLDNGVAENPGAVNKKFSRVNSGLNALYQQRMNELLTSEANYLALKSKKDAQGQQLANYKKIIAESSSREVDYLQLERKVDIAKKGYNTLLVQNGDSRLSNAMDLEGITNVTILDPAHSSINPVKPQVTLIIALAIFLGGLGSLVAAFALQFFGRTFETPEDVEKYFGLKVLASVPDFDDIK
jgi:polysaccharide biosynthesis protein PslE